MQSNNNLPRLQNNASNRQTGIGWAQVISGGIALIGVSGLYLAQKILHSWAGFAGVFGIPMWLFFVVGAWLISAGLNRLTVNSTFRRLDSRLTGGEFTIDKHAELIGLSVPQLLEDIALMHQRKYWSSVTVLEDALVVVPIGADPKGENHQKILASEGMRFLSKNAGRKIPFLPLAAFLIGLLFLLNLPLSKAIWLLVGLFAAVPLQKMSAAFTPKHPSILYNKIPQYVPGKIELELSGNEQADELIRQAEKHLTQLQDLEHQIKDPHLQQRISEISTGTKQMVERLRQSPQKHRQIRQTLDYSLPTAISLFYKYLELEAQPVKGENITRSMDKIHEMSDLVASTFQKELNAMYQDQTLDIEVDIEVMEQMIQKEELDFSPMASFRRDELKEAKKEVPPAIAFPSPLGTEAPVLMLPDEEEK